MTQPLNPQSPGHRVAGPGELKASEYIQAPAKLGVEAAADCPIADIKRRLNSVIKSPYLVVAMAGPACCWRSLPRRRSSASLDRTQSR